MEGDSHRRESESRPKTLGTQGFSIIMKVGPRVRRVFAVITAYPRRGSHLERARSMGVGEQHV